MNAIKSRKWCQWLMVCRFFFLVSSAAATSRTWTGAGGSSYWSASANWSPAGSPVFGDQLIFPGGASRLINTNDLPQLHLNSIVLNGSSGGFSLYGNPIYIDSNITDVHSGSVNTVNLDFQLTSNGSIDAGSSGTLIVNSAITANDELDIVTLSYTNLILSGAIQGGCSLVKIGEGSARLNGSTPNTYTGPTYIRGGQLHLSKVGADRTAIPGQLIIGDNTSIGSELYEDASGQHPANSDVTVSSNGFWHVNFDVTVTNLTLLRGLIRGTGTLHLDGDVLVETEFGESPWFTVESEIDCNVDLGTQTRTFQFWAFGSLDIQGAVSGGSGAGFTATGLGYITLARSNSFSGPVVIDGGSCTVSDPHSLGTTTAGTTLLNYGRLTINTSFFTNAILTEPITSGDGTITFSQDTILTGPLTVTNSLQMQMSSPSTTNFVTLSGTINGSGSIQFHGQHYRISGASPNSFNGSVTVGYDYDVSEASLLELARPPGVAAFQGSLTLRNGSTIAWLANAQLPGVDVTTDDNSTLDLENHSESLGNILFDGSGNFLNMNSVNIAGTVSVVSHSSTDQTAIMSGNLSLPANLTFNISNSISGPALYLLGNISGAGGIIKNGPGSMELLSGGTYTGPVAVNEGTLVVGFETALGSTASATTVKDGATLELDDLSALAEPLHITGDGTGGTNGALLCKVASDINSPIILDGPATIRCDGGSGVEFYLDSIISGTGPLSKLGLGRVTLAGASANTYTGDTLAKEGELLLSKPNGVISVPGNLVIGTRAGNFGGTTADVAYLQNDPVAGTNVVVNGGSFYDLNGYNESLGSVVLNNGGNIETFDGVLGFLGSGNTTRITVNPGASGASTISGHLQILLGGTFNVGSRLSSLVTAPELEISAQISDNLTGNFLKTGAGRMRLSGTNTFNATLTVDQGTLMVSNKLALGTSTGGTIVTGSGKLSLEGGLNIASEPLTLASSNSIALECLSGSNTWNAPIVLSGDSTINVAPANGYLQVLNSISGPGGLTKAGAGTLQFWGSAPNTYAGPTTVSAGILEAGRISQLSISPNVIVGDNSTSGTTATLRLLREQQIAPTANVTVNSSGKLDLYNFPSIPAPNQTLRTLEGSGLVSLSRADSKLTVSNEVSFDFNGTVIGSGVFTKIGLATMTTWGVWNLTTYVEISDGDFSVNGTVYNGLHVHNSARLRGDGQVMSTVSVDNGGVVAANSKFPDHQSGDLQITDLEMQPGGVVSLNIFGPAPTGGNDSLTIQTANITNAALSTGFSYPPREGDVVVQLNKTSLGPISGTFSGFQQGVPKNLGDYTVVPSYTGGSGNDFTLTVTNLAAGYFSYRLAEGNGNQTVEPDECNLLYLSLLNKRAVPLIITNTVLRATTPGALVTIGSATYPAIGASLASENITPFQFRTDPSLPCGTPVSFELVVGVLNEGVFAITFTVAAGADCSHPTGPCESCNVVSGQFTTNTLTTPYPLYFTGSYSLCYPPKAFPGIDPETNLPPIAFITHNFTNSTTNALCLTAQLEPACLGAPTNLFGVAAYLGNFSPDHPEFGYLGDNGDGYPTFSFQVPAGSNFVMVVMARATNLVCDRYTLELFGLPCAPPVLAIEQETAPSKIRVDWSTAYPDWIPQQAGNLYDSFTNVAQAAATVNGRYALTNLTTVTNQFYRLKH